MGESERLGFLINQLKTNAFQFSTHAKIAQGSVSNIINGKRRMSRDIIDSIIQYYPEVNIEWLLRGIGSPFHEVVQGANVVNESRGEYSAIKSPNDTISENEPDEEAMKKTIADNLRTAGKRWAITQIEMLEMLGGNVGRQGASTYFRGDTMPRLPMLLRFERYTGWPLSTLATMAIEFNQFPPEPMRGAEFPKLSAAEIMELKEDLNRLRLRLGRIIDKLEGE